MSADAAAICPECRQGKHQNCTRTVPTDNGPEVRPCVCLVANHGEDSPVRTVTGPYGNAQSLTVPASAPGALLWWLITAPAYHPFWSQYVLSVVTLADVDGLSPATLHFPGATHELLVIALDPGNPPARHAGDALETGPVPYLTPVNICHQFTATDDEMRKLAELACFGVVNGALNPETGDAPSRIREQWLTACVKTLAHFRGEEHAS